MALLAAVLLLAAPLCVSAADVSLTVQAEVIGTWKSSVVLPCSYSPVDLTRHTVSWLFNGERIFESDSKGDHTFLTKYRGKLSLSQDRQGGDVSLTILDLQTDDRGLYACKVSLMPQGAGELIQNEAEINLDVKKVEVSKPVIRPGGKSLTVSQGTTVKLTCSAEGSPPITYSWYRSSSSGSITIKTSSTSFTIEKADSSHSGTYFCEAENRIPEKKVQQSQILELRVTDVAIEATNIPTEVMHSSVGMVTSKPPTIAGDDRHRPSAPTAKEDETLRRNPQSTPKTDGTTGSPGDRRPQTTDAAGASGLPLYLIILIVVLCFILLCTVVAVFATRRRRKGSGHFGETQAMSALIGQANQAPPAVNICQINISQNNGCENVTMPRIENAYGPAMTKEREHDESAYQNLLVQQENEYELPMTTKEKTWQP